MDEHSFTDGKYFYLKIANTQENFDLLDDFSQDWWIGEEDEEFMDVGFLSQLWLENARTFLIEKSTQPWPRT